MGMGKVRRTRGTRTRYRSPSVVLVEGPHYARAGSEDASDPYERFLRGESLSDDEGDFHPEEEAPVQQHDTSDASEWEDEDGSVDEANDSEQVQLYADLSSDTTSAPVLLAHMTGSSASPLTRRGYRRLVSGTRRSPPPNDVDEWDEYVMERRHTKRSTVRDEDLQSENTRACVICTVEPRDIMCWPCR